MIAAKIQPTVAQIWAWLGEVPDPQLPAVSVVDLGIVRAVRWEGGELVVAVTPTYTGCPATEAIRRDIQAALDARGIRRLRLETRLAPPWTSDWISAAGRQRLRMAGIAPPAPSAVACPRCGSRRTTLLSAFGSTPCKALYRCRDCLEPFHSFKCL